MMIGVLCPGVSVLSSLASIISIDVNIFIIIVIIITFWTLLSNIGLSHSAAGVCPIRASLLPYTEFLFPDGV